MTLILTVLEIVAPVFMLAGAGFVWVKLGFEYRVEFVTRLAMTLAVPCLIFTALMTSDIDGGALAALTLAGLVAYGLVTLVMWGLVLVFKLERRTYLAPLIFGNTGNIGLPLALFAFGQAGLSYAVIIFAITGILSFTFGVWLVSGGGSLRKVFSEPVVGATLLGALFLWRGWETPTFMTNALELVGQMAMPMMLLTLGVAVARLKPTHLGRGLVMALVKVAICAGLATLTGLWFALPPIAFGVLVMQVSAPVAVTSYLLAAKYGANSEEVAGMVVISTLLAVLTLPLILAFVI